MAKKKAAKIEAPVLTAEEQAQQEKEFAKRYATHMIEMQKTAVQKQLTKMIEAFRRAADEVEQQGARLIEEMEKRERGESVEFSSGSAERASWIVNTTMWVMPNMTPQDLIAEAAKFDAAVAKSKE